MTIRITFSASKPRIEELIRQLEKRFKIERGEESLKSHTFVQFEVPKDMDDDGGLENILQELVQLGCHISK